MRYTKQTIENTFFADGTADGDLMKNCTITTIKKIFGITYRMDVVIETNIITDEKSNTGKKNVGFKTRE